jgi:hypothetical protein
MCVLVFVRAIRSCAVVLHSPVLQATLCNVYAHYKLSRVYMHTGAHWLQISMPLLLNETVLQILHNMCNSI